jgi:hypothetical protein
MCTTSKKSDTLTRIIVGIVTSTIVALIVYCGFMLWDEGIDKESLNTPTNPPTHLKHLAFELFKRFKRILNPARKVRQANAIPI